MARANKRPKKIGPAQQVARVLITSILQIFFWIMKTLRYKNRLDIEHPCIMAIYHDELMPLVYYFRNQGITSIASRNHFGYSIAKVMERYDYEVALGSPSRGGKDAFLQLLRAARKGKSIAFTVDGSRGPRHEMKQGAMVLAKRTKLPLYLIRASYDGWRIERSWDKSKFPKPFAEVSFNYKRFALEDYADEADLNIALLAAQNELSGLQADDYQAPK